MTEFEVANVVGLITYRQELELSTLAETLEQRDEIRSVTYEPADNHWLQARVAPDDTYVSFYRCGKCSVAGAESPAHFAEIADRVNTLMSDLLGFAYEPTADIKNIVATTTLGSVPPLETVAIGLALERTEYEPEQFPALIYRGGESVTLIFPSGKLVCTGLTSLDAVSVALDTVTAQVAAVDGTSSAAGTGSAGSPHG